MLSRLARPAFLLLATLGLMLFVAACADDPVDAPEPEIHVTATIFPVASWTEAVAGDRASVTTMVPAGVDPHHWEAGPDAIARMQGSDAFIYVDEDYEFWLDGILQEWSEDNSGPARLGLLHHVDPLPWDEDDHEHNHDDEHAHDDDHDHGDEDPHFWTDPVRAIMAVEAIRDFLSEIDPEGAELYEENGAAYIAEITALHESFEQALDGCELDFFISTHAAFRYLAESYDLRNVSIMAVVPEAEPSPRDLEQIIALAREHDVEYIFYERGVSPAASETVAHEVGADTLLLHPLEAVASEDLEAGETYLSLMEQNLDNLRLALRCP